MLQAAGPDRCMVWKGHYLAQTAVYDTTQTAPESEDFDMYAPANRAIELWSTLKDLAYPRGTPSTFQSLSGSSILEYSGRRRQRPIRLHRGGGRLLPGIWLLPKARRLSPVVCGSALKRDRST